jgi:hypothetical protein
MSWVICPEKTIDIPVKVQDRECLACMRCEKAFDIWLATLPVIPKDADEMLLKKKRKSGRCPRVTGLDYCYAAKRLCSYNPVCADEHPRMIHNVLHRMEVNMLVVKTHDGALITAVKANVPKDITDLSTVAAVYEVKQKLVMKKALVPVAKEAELQSPKLPANFNKGGMFLLEKDGAVTAPVALDVFLKMASEGKEEVSALVVSKIYQPSVEIKLVPATPPKKPVAKKPVNGNGAANGNGGPK